MWGWTWISDNGYSAGVTPLFVKTTGERSVHSIYNKMYPKKKKKISMKYQCVHFSQQNIPRKHLKGHPTVQLFLLVSNWTKSDPQN